MQSRSWVDGHFIPSRLLIRCSQLIEKAVELEPKNSAYRTELGHVRLLQDFISVAIESYRLAITLDDNNVEAMQGLIMGQLLNNETREAGQQLDFFNEMGLSGSPGEIPYLNSLFDWKLNKDVSKRLEYIEKLYTDLQALSVSFAPSLQGYTIINPDLLLLASVNYNSSSF